MKALNGISILIILAILIAFLVFKFTVIYIPMGAVGVRIQQYAMLGEKGVVQEDFTPGFHRSFGMIDRWELFDATVQALEMTREPGQGDRGGRDDVRVQSADGYSVSVDVTVKYRILKDSVHKLYQDTGAGNRYKEIVRNESERACQTTFGEMKTEEFYDPKTRRTKAKEVSRSLRLSLEDNYVDVIDVLIRNVQFDPQYEDKIRRKKLADQEVELYKSTKRAEEMRGKTQKIEAETGAKVKVITKEKEAELIKMEATAELEIAKIRAEYELYATKKNADADLDAAQKIAKGELLMKIAEAKGESLRNEAMQGVGGSVIVALEAAKNLNLADITISTVDTDLLDVDAMASKLGAPAVK